MFTSKSLAALSIASLSMLPFAKEVKSDDYKKGLYGYIGAGSGTFSDLVIQGTPFSVNFDPGFSFESSLGYDFGKHFRVDASYSNTTSTTVTDNNAKFRSIIFNGYLDFPIENTKWTPFIGAGYGSTNVDAENLCTAGGTDNCKDDVATYSISGGLSYALDSDKDITGKITYLGFDTINVIDDGLAAGVTDSETLSVHIGVKFKF
tara:strand:+ start:553 stop:1167 length:615 start_codon:yes stop_codon:yes gene_type:complete